MFISHQPAIPFYLWTKKHPTACIMVTLELLWTILLRQSKSWKMFPWSKNCFCVPENSNWMTPFSCRVSPILFWWKSVTPPFSSKNSSRANRWSRLVNVLRVWESSKGSNKSSVSAEEALHQRVSSQNAWIFYHYADCQCRDKTLTNRIQGETQFFDNFWHKNITFNTEVYTYFIPFRIIKCDKICNSNKTNVVINVSPQSQSFSPRISQEEGLGRSASGLSGSWESPYQPPQPGNQDWRYWIIPELPLLGMDVVGDDGFGSLLGSRKFCRRGQRKKIS